MLIAMSKDRTTITKEVRNYAVEQCTGSLINLVITLISPFFFCKSNNKKKEAMFFSNEEHNLLIVYPMAFIKLFLVVYENRGTKIYHRGTSGFSSF